MQPMGDARNDREGDDSYGFTRYNRRHQPISGRIVFDQRGAGREGGLEFCQ